jgi:hypothetical protein
MPVSKYTLTDHVHDTTIYNASQTHISEERIEYYKIEWYSYVNLTNGLFKTSPEI